MGPDMRPVGKTRGPRVPEAAPVVTGLDGVVRRAGFLLTEWRYVQFVNKRAALYAAKAALFRPRHQDAVRIVWKQMRVWSL